MDILVVDDDRDTREMYAQYLRWAGHAVREAADPSSALEQAFASPPAAVVMDLAMPQAGGLDAVKRLRGDPRTAGVAVIICTAYLPGDQGMRALDAVGYDAYLTKPVLPQELVDEVVRVLHDRAQPERPRSSTTSRSRSPRS